MKLSAFALASALSGVASVSASDFSLRSVARALMGTQETLTETDADIRVVLPGLAQEVDKNDMHIISKSIAEAYNQVYTEATGQSMNSFDPVAMSQSTYSPYHWSSGECRYYCPDDDAFDADGKEATEKAQLVVGRTAFSQSTYSPYHWSSGECRFWCPDDDSFAAEAGMSLTDLHDKFEETFCSLVRTSGSANLATVHGCSLSFLETTAGHAPGSLPAASSPFNKACKDNEHMEAQLVLPGLLHDFTEEDLALIGDSIQSAYNDAFLSTGLAIGKFAPVGNLELSMYGPHHDWTDGDAFAQQGLTKLLVARVAPLCPNGGGPPGEEEKTAEETKTTRKNIAYLHKAFEKTLCKKLQNSGAANFANVEECVFRMVSSPAATSTTLSTK